MNRKVMVTSKSFADSDAAQDLLLRSGYDIAWDLAAEGPAGSTNRNDDAEAIICSVEPITAEFMDRATRLKVIARIGVGYDAVDVAAATQRGIAVCIAPTNAESVADLTIAFIICVARELVQSNAAVQQGVWKRNPGMELRDKTLSIIGLGRIGKAVALRAKPFGMRVLANDIVRDEAFASQHGIEYVDLERALREGDFVSVHTPHTPETDKIVNAGTLGMMKPGGYVINTARGGMVDEDALAAAVKSGHLAGAAVDVLREEPPTNSPLIGDPRIIITPHLAGVTRESVERMSVMAAQNVVTVLNGHRSPNTVNPEAYAVTTRGR